jgi:hypothetical protein
VCFLKFLIHFITCIILTDLSFDRTDNNPDDSSSKRTERIVTSEWQRHRRWSRVSKMRRRQVEFGRVSTLVLAAAGAISQVADLKVPVQYKTGVSFFGMCSIGSVPFVKKWLLNENEIKNMVRSFTTSQAIKAEVYKFRAQATPYTSANPKRTLKIFQQRCQELSNNARQYDSKFDLMLQDSKPPPPAGVLNAVDGYIENRLDKQINNVYMKKGITLTRRNAFCTYSEYALLGLAFMAGVSQNEIISQQLPTVVNKLVGKCSGWGAACTAASGSFGSHIAAQKFTEISYRYFGAAENLQNVKDNWPCDATPGSADWNNCVTQCEDIIRSTVDYFAVTKSADENMKLSQPSTKKVIEDVVWNPNIVLGTDDSGFYPAVDRMKWLMETKSLTEKQAKNKVMMEYPENF